MHKQAGRFVSIRVREVGKGKVGQACEAWRVPGLHKMPAPDACII